MTEGEQRQRLFEALARGALAGAQPLLLVIDDLQWCDQETLEFLHYLVRLDPRAPLLVAATARPEEIAPSHPASALLAGLHAIEKVVEITLSPLDRVAVNTLAQQLSEKPLPPRVRSAIQGRLNQLSPEAGDLVAVAATVGREFTHEVLAAASGYAEDTVVAGLDELWRRRIIREHGVHSYDFSHDKIREVAYGEVGPARRRQLHRAVAGALSAIHAADPGPVSGRLGAHYERAGQPGPAVVQYQLAASVAQRVFANKEVVPYLTRALELLEQLPAGVGWTEVQRGRAEAGLERMLSGFQKMDSAGMRTERTYLLLLLSQVPTLAGRAAAASSTLREALEHTERTGQWYLKAELQRAAGRNG